MPKKQKAHSKIHASKEICKARQFSLFSEKITLPNHDEITQVFRFSMPKIQDMIDQDKIVDALSILKI